MTSDDLRRIFTGRTLFRLDTILAPRMIPIIYAVGLLALLLTWVAYRTVDVRFLSLVFFDPRLVVIGILCGALIGVLGSATSVWSHLRRI